MNIPAKQIGINGFKKGQSGNPKGRPPTAKCIPDLLRKIGDQPPTEFILAKLRGKYGPLCSPKTMREAMLLSTYCDAIFENDNHARQMIMERTEGKVTDKLEVNDVTVSTDNVNSLSTEQLLQVAARLEVTTTVQRRIIRR